MFNGHKNESLLMWKAEKKKALCSCSAIFRLLPSSQTATLPTHTRAHTHTHTVSPPFKGCCTHRLTSLEALMGQMHFTGLSKASSCQRKDEEAPVVPRKGTPKQPPLKPQDTSRTSLDHSRNRSGALYLPNGDNIQLSTPAVKSDVTDE